MSNMSKKLVLSILAVVLTVVALGTTTFAWFTLTNVAEVQAFEADVTAGEGIEISLNGLDWYTTITTELIEEYLFDPASSGYLGANWTFNDSTTEDGVAFSNIVGNDARYIEFPLFFRSQDVDTINWTGVELSTPQTVTFTVDVPSFTYRTETYIQGDPAVGEIEGIDVSDAARIAIISNTGTAYTVAYEKAASTANTVLGGLTDADLTNGGVGTTGSVNYYYLKNDVLPLGAEEVTVLSTITDLGAGQTVLDLTENAPTAPYLYTGNLTVRVWIEGWDADTFNSIFGATLSTSLEFTGTNS